jgi:hypothetical protein
VLVTGVPECDEEYPLPLICLVCHCTVFVQHTYMVMS